MKTTITTMNPSTPSMTSVEIAELTDKQHAHVMRDIRSMFSELGLSISGLSSYINSQNKEQPMFILDKELTMTLVTGYSIKLRNAVVKRLEQLESNTGTLALPDFSNPVEAARAWANELEAKQLAQKALALSAPKVEFVEKYVEAEGLFGFRQVAKLYNIKEKEFRTFLQDKHIMYKSGKDWMIYQPHLAAGRFEIKTGESKSRTFSTSYFTSKGVYWIGELLGKVGA